MEKNFISQILEYFGYIAAIVVAFSQYILRDSFQVFFNESPEIYAVSSLFALFVSLVVIVAVFSNRYTIGTKYYFSNKKKTDYFNKLREEQEAQKSAQQNNQVYNPKHVLEPRSITLKQFAVVLIILSAISFFCLIYLSDIYLKSLSYIVLVASIVGSISIYATSLYNENEWKQRERTKKDLIMSKIKDHFVGEIKINLSWKNNTNIVQPIQNMTIERQGKKYNVVVDINDPENFFSIQEIIEERV